MDTLRKKTMANDIHRGHQGSVNYGVPSTVVSVDNCTRNQQEELIKAYNETMMVNDNKLPLIQFTIRSKRGGVSSQVKGPKSRKNRPVFTEGLSSKSIKEEPVFYLRNQLILSSNQPGSVHYIRDKSKLILEAATVNAKKDRTNSQDSHRNNSNLDVVNTVDTSSAQDVKLTRNNTMMLPKIFMERELPFSMSSVRQKRKQSPRDLLTRQYMQFPDNTKENIPLSYISQSRLMNRDAIVPYNSPIKSVSEVYNEDLKYLETQTSFVVGEGPMTDRSQVIFSRTSEVPVVSVGDEVNIEYYRKFRPNARSVAGTDVDDYDLSRPTTMESRYAISTPGRKLRPSNKAQLLLTSRSLGAPSKEKKDNQRGVVIVEEENVVHNIVSGMDNTANNTVKRIMIGDPLKDSNKQDMKLNNSNLEDLYERGVMQMSNRKSYISRSPVKRMYDRLYNNGCNSVILGNPPPSIATMASGTPYDFKGTPGFVSPMKDIAGFKGTPGFVSPMKDNAGFKGTPGFVSPMKDNISDKNTKEDGPKLAVIGSRSLQNNLESEDV